MSEKVHKCLKMEHNFNELNLRRGPKMQRYYRIKKYVYKKKQQSFQLSVRHETNFIQVLFVLENNLLVAHFTANSETQIKYI